MSCVGRSDTEAELVVRRILRRLKLDIETHVESLPGKPDVVVRKYRTVIQVHGCFWHGHDCRKGRLPTRNRSYWRLKIDRNRRRDESVKRRLRGLGWHVLTLWECRLKDWEPEKLARRLKHLKAQGAPSRRQ